MNATATHLPAGRYLAPPLAIFVVVLGVYVTTTCPTVPPGDSGELIAVAHTWGIAHPPGYPLYTLLAAAVDRLLPWGEPAWRVNLLSGLCGAAAAAFLFAVTRRISGSIPAGLVAAGLFAFSPIAWLYASVAEVFTLNALLAYAATWAMFRLLAKPHEPRTVRRRAALVGVLLGLGLSNHHTTILVGLAFSLVAVGATVARRLRASWWRAAVPWGLLGLAIGILPYVYLPLATRADPAVCWGQADTLGGFIRHITRAEYGSFQLVPADLAASGLAWHTHLVEFARWVWRDTWGAGPALGFLGLLGLVRGVGRTNGVGRAGVILAAVCLLTTGGVFLLLVNAPLDPPLMRGVVARFYILPLGFLSMLAGCGIALLLRLGRTRLGPRGARIARSALALAASAYVCGLVAANHARVDQSDNVVTRNLGLDILRGLPADALLFSRTDLVTNALAYAQHGLGQRRDVVVIDQEMLTYAWHAARMRRRHPAINLPGERYDGRTVFNLDLIDANLPHRPVYFFGFKEESFRAKYRDEPHGLVRQIVPAGAVTDPIALLDANEALVAAMSREGRGSEHPAETFEYEAAGHYAELFFQLGWLAEQAQRYERAAEHYRRAFALRADWRFARNLGVVLADRLGRPAEAADWLERSLQLNPATPDASAVRAKIDYHPREGKGKDE